MQSRREFLKSSAAVLAMGVMAGCGVSTGKAESEEKQVAAPSFPFEWHSLDVEEVQKRTFEGFYTLGGCARAVFNGIIGLLAEQYGYPYNQVPTEMYANGHSGYLVGSLCGSLGGAAGVLGLLLPTDEVDDVLKELLTWYSNAEMPYYQPDMELITTVANSVNCNDSLGKWMTTAGVAEKSDPKRKARCAGVSADVAKKVCELLDVHFGFAVAEAEEEKSFECGENQYIGTGTGMEGDVVVRVTMDGDKIAAVEVLQHNETPGVGTPAVEQMPAKFVNLSTLEQVDGVDTISSSTVTSNAIKDAVKDALSQVK
ncbi:MAG: C-GCAxxG-C-C family (seleno)protein [Clostridia bacterium]|nr:C-GCAxxG-C-C family (seleno)protein [Clostridia bacterium]